MQPILIQPTVTIPKQSVNSRLSPMFFFGSSSTLSLYQTGKGKRSKREREGGAKRGETDSNIIYKRKRGARSKAQKTGLIW